MASKKDSVPILVTDEVELALDDGDLDTMALDLDTILEESTLEVVLEPAVTPDITPLKPTIQVPESAVKVPVVTTTIENLITTIDDSVEYLTWLIYGKNGTGKTTLLSTAEGMLILAAEDGTLSIRTKGKNARKIKIDSWDKLEGIYWVLKNGKQTKNGIEIGTASGKYTVKYLAIDTVTKLAEVCMRNVVLGERENDASKDIITKTMRNWGDMSEKMKYWLQQFEELPLQRVWVFQENSNSEDVESDEFSIYPAVNKSLRTYVMSEADIIARTYIAKSDTTFNGIQYRISAAPNPNYVTKDRTNSINTAPIANPDLTKLYKKVFSI